MNGDGGFDLDSAASSISSCLSGDVSSLKTTLSSLKSKLSSISDYDGINLSINASTLASNFSNKIEDLETVLTNMQNYVKGEIEIDGATIFESVGVPYETLFQTDGTREGNAQAIWNFLKYKGLSEGAIAGVLGNIQAECNLDPAAVEPNGEGHGLIQWSFGRRANLLTAAQNQGVDWTNLQFQLEYLWSESLDPNCSFGQSLMAAGFYDENISASEAAKIFHAVVEQSPDSEEMIKNNRMAVAESWYQKLKGTSAGNVNAKLTSASRSIIPQNSKQINGNASSTGAYTTNYGYTSNYSGWTSGGGGTSSGSTGTPYIDSDGIKRYFPYSTADRSIKIKDVDYETLEEDLEAIEGTDVYVPDGLGKIHSYMGWQCISSRTSEQYKLIESAGMQFDSDGFGKIGDRYVVATTLTFGNVGDFIDVVQDDGTIIKCIIGDIKSQHDAGCNMWGHNDGQCVVEFVVDKSSWYGTNKTVVCYHPEWRQTIEKIVNKGNYFDMANDYKMVNGQRVASKIAKTSSIKNIMTKNGSTSSQNSSSQNESKASTKDTTTQNN